MIRQPTCIAGVLVLILFDTGRSFSADKPDAVAERIADQIATFEVLTQRFYGRRDFGDGVRDIAVLRFSRSAEPFELKFARCLSIAFDGASEDKLPSKALLKAVLDLDAAVLKLAMEDPKFAHGLVKARVEALAAEEKARKTDDKWEITYISAHTAEDAAKFFRVAAMVESVMTKDYQDGRNQLRAMVFKALTDNPEALKKLAQVPQASEEMPKSRDRVKSLIENARKK